MISSGVLLPEALHIVGSQLYHTYFQEVIAVVSQSVQEGNSLSVALQQYPHIFNSMMIAMVQTGQEAGCLSLALSLLAGIGVWYDICVCNCCVNLFVSFFLFSLIVCG